jgi:hypothetical protein
MRTLNREPKKLSAAFLRFDHETGGNQPQAEALPNSVSVVIVAYTGTATFSTISFTT